MLHLLLLLSFFFFNDTATTEIYTLSLHDALPISDGRRPWPAWLHLGRTDASACPRPGPSEVARPAWACSLAARDRKSTRLNSSHQIISYAVFCLKKKKNIQRFHITM